MNEYLKNLNKVEFVLTYACTGRCKHCSVGDHNDCTERIDPKIAADAVRKIAAEYGIETVMTFGGEPLLHTEAVYAIMNAAKEMNITRRQVITNGYFSNAPHRIREVAECLAECGVNDLLLSVDAFHMETIPIDTVRLFAYEVKRCGISVRLQPAWLVSSDDKNGYNLETRRILDSFADMGICENDGNVIFPEGNALKYLAEYFPDFRPENPYVEDECDLHCISFSPDGSVLNGNVYRNDITEIMGDYKPKGK